MDAGRTSLVSARAFGHAMIAVFLIAFGGSHGAWAQAPARAAPAAAEIVDRVPAAEAPAGPTGGRDANRSPESLNWSVARAVAMTDNLELLVARQQVTTLEAELERAGLRPNPTLTLSDTGWKLNQSALGRASDLVARVDQTIERGGKPQLRVAQGRAALTAARLDLLRIERSVLTRLASALIDLDTARGRRDAAREIAHSLERTDAIARQRLKAGDLSEVAAARVGAEAARARNDVTLAQNDINDSLQALRLLLGHRSTTALEDLPIDVDSLPGAVRVSMSGSASDVGDVAEYERSADAASAQQRELAARAARDLAQAQRSRDISIGVQMERMPYTQSAALGVSASFPLFVFNDYSADIRRADSELQNARLESQRLALQWSADRLRLRQALANAAERERRLGDEALPPAQRNAQTVEFSFRRGAASVLEVLDAQRALRTTQLDVLAARADRRRASVALTLLDDPRYHADAAGLSLGTPR